MDFGDDDPDTREYAALEPPARRQRGFGRVRFLVVSEKQLGREYVVRAGSTLGRSSACSVVLDDPTVSRLHARVVEDERGLRLEDVAQKGTTLANGEPVTSHPLCLGDRIRLGREVTFFVGPLDRGSESADQDDRLRGLGLMSAGVAHDVLNLLAVIRTSLDYLGTRGRAPSLGDPHVRECLDDMDLAAEKAADLMKGMLALGRRDQESARACDLSRVCADVARLVHTSLPAGVSMETRFVEPCMVLGQPTQLAQVVLNLCLNATAAMPDGGVLRIATGLQGEDEVELRVSDTGVGMDEELRARAFERFFTTKGEAGTGLGLSTVQDVARWHGGRVDLESEPGRGTVFHVRLPRHLPERREKKETVRISLSEPPPPWTTRVLLLEADPMLARASARTLQQAGHVVSLASGLDEACDRLAGEPMDLVLFCVDSVGTAPRTAMNRLLEAGPNARVGLITSYPTRTLDALCRQDGVVGLLRRPFAAAELEGFVSDSLRRAARTS